MTRWMERQSRTLLCGLLALFVAAGCSEDPSEPKEANDGYETPVPPSSQSLTFDLAAMESGDGLQGAGFQPNAVGFHWLNAALRVTAINLTVVAVLHHPATVLGLALSAEPEYIGDGTFRWRYNWRHLSEDITVDLIGEVKTDVVEWELRLAGTFDGRNHDDDVWFHGEMQHGRAEGFWIFTDLKDSPSDVARVDWDLEPDGRSTLSFENVDVASPEHRDRLSYDVQAGHIDIDIEILDQSAGKRSLIEWNTTSGAGGPFGGEGTNESQSLFWPLKVA